MRRVGQTGDAALDYRTLEPPPPEEQASHGALPVASRRALAPRRRGAFLHGERSDAELTAQWERLESAAAALAPNAAPGEAAGHRPGEVAGEVPGEVAVAFGRSLPLRRRAGDACWLTFDELCGAVPGVPALGATDYLALAATARTVFVSGLPVLHVRQVCIPNSHPHPHPITLTLALALALTLTLTLTLTL